jgi:Coenzyme PQQ synthesis protein D (PqqD)
VTVSQRKTISPSSIVAVAKDQVSCDLGGEAAILNLKSGIYYGLDDVGATIWGLIAKPKPVSEIRDALLELYEVEPARCESDLIALLQDLAAKGLVQVTDAAAC